MNQPKSLNSSLINYNDDNIYDNELALFQSKNKFNNKSQTHRSNSTISKREKYNLSTNSIRSQKTKQILQKTNSDYDLNDFIRNKDRIEVEISLVKFKSYKRI